MDKFQVNKILFAETPNSYYYPYQNWYFPLKRACKEIVTFDTRWNYYIYGLAGMNKRFLECIQKEQPDYIFLWVRLDQFSFDTLLKIRDISPKTKTLVFFGDDEAAFTGHSRYFVLFVDYALIPQKKCLKWYEQDGVHRAFFSAGIDTGFFRPLKLEKKYDVTFIGSPKLKESKRYELIKFLKDNGIRIKLFGWGWDNYPEFKEIYGGPLEAEKMVEILNQSKINLCFSKNNYGDSQVKGKVFEAGACKTFVLTESCKDYEGIFEEGKEMIMFKDNPDLLKKIKYYIKHEREREKIAENAYNRILKEYSLDVELKRIFKKIEKNKTHEPLPEIDQKCICLSKRDLSSNINLLESKLKDFDYVFFKEGKCQSLKFRTYLQAYSLEKTKKPISCCDYYLNSKFLGDYLYVYAEPSCKRTDKSRFRKLFSINQIMVSKKYFLENIETFRKTFDGVRMDFLNWENTVFVSFPLVRLKKLNTSDYEVIKKSSEFRFLYYLYALKFHKTLLIKPYIYALAWEIIKGKTFFLKALIEVFKDKGKRNKINIIENTSRK